MSIADVENEFEKLWRLLEKIKYPVQPTKQDNEHDVNELPKDRIRNKLINGDTAALLPIISFSLLIFSKRLSTYLLNKGYKIYGQSDTRFTDEIYKMLRKEFNHNPTLQSSQFLTVGVSVYMYILYLIFNTIQVC